MLRRSAKRAFANAIILLYHDVTKTLFPNAQDSRQWAILPVKSFANITEAMEIHD
jgi:hypothetical protein